MAIILDSDVIIRGEKGAFDLAGWLAARPQEEFAAAAITIAELWHGVERAAGKRRSLREAYLLAVISGLAVLPYTQTTALVHARLWAELESAGAMIGYYDVIVAATAIEQGCAVATFNQKHFQAVSGLTVIDPNL